MPYDIFAALVVFVFATAFTPGPNNIMVTVSGVNFGFVRTIPHMVGITAGFVVLLLAASAGLGLIFSTMPQLQTALKIAGALYMLWLAWKVANARPQSGDVDLARPMTFWQAVAFQWVNPKALVMSLTMVALFVRPENRVLDAAILIAVNVVFTAATVITWTGFGVALRGLLSNPRHARIFNIVMALLLVASIVPMVL
ncbi:LysE family translocator [Undibacter mobilis]|uniref:LysE family translocator n=1 Tax=Undibacter mobilis TaxID=2292256 RepID=A0A371BCF7_9BRAD|nr:LysE family translocator [Undibacter mobilis]RDV05041.1 LysE family translocator [Undibacter mobilis]